MPKHDSVERNRRAMLGAGGALILSATLLPARSFAQPSGGKYDGILLQHGAVQTQLRQLFDWSQGALLGLDVVVCMAYLTHALALIFVRRGSSVDS